MSDERLLPRFTGMMFVWAMLIIILAGIKVASVIIVPFLLACFIAIICSPIVALLQCLKIPRILAIILVILLVITFCLLFAGITSSSITEFRAHLPFYQQQINDIFDGYLQQLNMLGLAVNLKTLLSYFDPSKAWVVAGNLLNSLTGIMTNIFLILLTTIFILLEAPYMSHKLHTALQDPKIKMQQIDRLLQSVNSYIAVKSLISLVTALLVGVLLWIFNLNFIILWMLLAFVLNYIPNIGSLLAATPPVLLAVVSLGLAPALSIATGYVVINIVMGNFIEPKVMGKELGLSALVIFLSLVFWGWLLGSMGMLLSAPLTMAVKIALEAFPSTRWIAVLLGSSDKQSN